MSLIPQFMILIPPRSISSSAAIAPRAVRLFLIRGFQVERFTRRVNLSSEDLWNGDDQRLTGRARGRQYAPVLGGGRCQPHAAPRRREAGWDSSWGCSSPW